MCKGDTRQKIISASSTTKQSKHPLLMLSVKSYGTTTAPVTSTLATAALMASMLVFMELLTRAIIFNLRHLHPILEDTTSRFILARHIGVDSLSCCIVAWLGWNSRQICWEMVTAFQGKGGMTKEGNSDRMYKYQPAAARIATFFLAYQAKNTYDTIVWNDGIEYIFHHACSITVAWGALHPCLVQFYGIFFLGVSEVSTAVLCILANFDPDQGVDGLGDAFPLAKVLIGLCFVVSFIVCRTILWPICSYYFVRDAIWALKDTENPHLKGRATWIRVFMWCLTGLSALQILWLGMIFFIAQKELSDIGWI